MSKKRLANGKHTLAFLLILILGIYLRFHNLVDNPAWYTDETTHIEIARWLVQGDIRYFAIQESWLIFARLPLFEYLLAGVFQLFGIGMLSLRGLTASLGIGTGILLYVALWQMTTNRRIGLVISTLWFIMPQAVLYNRFGFSYNLLCPLIVVILWSFYQYRVTHARRWLLLSVMAIGFGMLTDVIAWTFVLPLLLVIIGVRWRDAIWAIGVACLPLGLYFIGQLVTIPELFLFDLGYTLSRTGGGDFISQLSLLNQNFLTLLQNPWWLLGLLGIFLIESKSLRTVMLISLIPLLVVGRTVPLFSLSAYYVLPFLPLVTIGVGFFLMRSWAFCKEQFDNRIASWGMRVLLILPLLTLTWGTLQSADETILTEIDVFLVDSVSARSVADYINEHADAGDLVVTSAPIGWMIAPTIHVAEFQMSAIADGRDAVHLPGDLSADRFVFDTEYQQARFVVVDNLWRNWGAVHIPQVAEMMQVVADWDVVFFAGMITVYEQP